MDCTETQYSGTIMKEKVRLTVDMSQAEHMCIKMACAKLGISMREFLIYSAFKQIEEIEDEALANKARDILRDIEAGKERSISWEEMKRRIA